MKIKIVFVLALLALSPAFGQEGDDAAARRASELEERIAKSCTADPENELCQVYLRGLRHGLMITSRRAELSAQVWEWVLSKYPERFPEAGGRAAGLGSIVCYPEESKFTPAFRAALASHAELFELKLPDLVSLSMPFTDTIYRACRDAWLTQKLTPPPDVFDVKAPRSKP
jgi:hypothetical protein